MSQIHFFFPYKHISLKDRKQLKDFLRDIFTKEKKKLGTLRYIFCSDKELLQINRQYLHHDFFTDIITFDLGTADTI